MMENSTVVLTLLSLLYCVVFITCSKPTSTCAGNYRQCGDNKCCCLSGKAKCANFGEDLNYIPKFTRDIVKLWFTNNSLSDISSVTFENLTHIPFIEIHLVQNKIKNIAEDAFKDLRSMQLLEISRNSKLNVSSLWDSFKSMVTKRRLSLKLNSIGIRTLDNDSLGFLRNSKIKVNRINLANNDIEHLNFSAFVGLNDLTELDVSINKLSQVSKPVYLRSLTSLRLSGNEIPGYPNFLCSCNTSVHYFPQLKQLDISNNFISEIRPDNWNCLDMLDKLTLSGNIIKSIPKQVFSRLAKLRDLFVSNMRCSLKHIHQYGFKSTSIQHLEIMENNLNFYKIKKRNESIYIFQNIPNLEKLDVSNNQFSRLTDTQVLNMFSNLKKLKTLKAVGIELATIPKSFFSTMPMLTDIELDDNNIRDLKDAFQGVHHLKRISIPRNNIQVIKEGTFPDKLMQTLTELNLASNPFACGCEMIWFRGWIDRNIKRNKSNRISVGEMFSVDNIENSNNVNSINRGRNVTGRNGTFVKWSNGHRGGNVTFVNWSNKYRGGNVTFVNWPNGYICRSPDSKRNIKVIDYHPTEESCKTHDPLTIAYVVIGSFMGTFSIMFFIVYKNQWYIKYIFYKMKIRARSKDLERQPLLEPIAVHYDGYVIYSHDSDGDGEFVHKDLIQVLEEKFGYKLHIWHRNAESGAKLEVMVDAIYNSDNVIAVISKEFMKDSWCQFAMDVAMDRQIDLKRENLMLVILEDVNLKSFSKYWCVILTKTPTAYWCADKSEIKRSVFEQKCIQQLGSPLRETE